MPSFPKLKSTLLRLFGLRFSDAQVEKEYQETRMPLTKNFLKHLIAVMVFFTLYSVVAAIANNRAFVPNANTCLLVITILLLKYHDRLKFIMEPIIVVISLMLYGIGLKVIRVFFQGNLTPFVFYIGYNFALFQRLIETRLVKSGSATALYLGFFVLRLTIISEFTAPALIIQVILEALLLISNIERERNIRKLFKSFYDYKVNLLKFKDLITDYFPENIAIFNKDFSKTLFTNETFQKCFECSNSNAGDLIKNLKIDKDSIQGVEITPENQENLGSAFKALSGSQEAENKKIVSFNVRNSGEKQVYQTKILKLFWDQEEANAVIFSDLTQQETILALKVADAHKDKVIATVSHELRSPINAILGCTKILEEMVKSNPQMQFYLSACKYSANWLLTLVNSILDLSQIRGNSIKLNPASFNLRESLEEIKKMFSFQCAQKSLELKFELAQDLPQVVYTDKNRLAQVLINLLNNALKFTYKGSITLKVRNSRKDPKTLIFKVIDTGIGIKDQDKEKLFKMYGRVDQADQSINTQGVGLGLTISNELVRLLNPNKEFSGIKCKSEFSKGTSFSFAIMRNLVLDELTSDENVGNFASHNCTQFPPVKDYKFMSAAALNANNVQTRRSLNVHADDVSESESEFSVVSRNFVRSGARNRPGSLSTSPSVCSESSLPEDLPRKSTNNWVLLVDDMPFNLIVASHILEKKGFKVKTALNGEEAIKVMTEHCKSGQKFQFVLMDCQMPVMDGFEATEALVGMMKRKEIPEVPIIAFSANNSKKDVDRAMKSGMCNFLFKPLEEEQFNKVIAASCNFLQL